ncbi:MAG TPA: AMP-binding protein [Candidatus Binatia bacterium]|nr:AMP-binding protein [Candidatus Binatia bacterium]
MSNTETNYRHLGEVFFHRAAQLGDQTFLKLQSGGKFEEISWRDFETMVRETLLGLDALGLRAGDRVAIVGDNSLPWLCADMATLAAGLSNVVMSSRVSDITLLKQLAHAGARAVFVMDETAAGRMLNLKGQLPALEHIIVFTSPASHLPSALSFDDLRARGRRAPEARLRQILESVHEDDLATIMYTSGSTGDPKGVMKTQKNILSNITSGQPLTLSKPGEVAAIVMTTSHLLGRYCFHKGAATGRTTAMLEATELDVDVPSIAALSPTSMTIVPRVMERIWSALMARDDNGRSWEELERLDRKKQDGGALEADEGARFEDLQRRLKDSVRGALGGRIKYITWAGAPMAPRIIRFFQLVGVPLLGSYGSTECGGVTLSGFGDIRPGNLGKPFGNIEVRIADDDEILVRGPTVTPGYFNDPGATGEVLDGDGWFHSGDLGVMESDGSLRIVGRKKDVFYCTDGSNIDPRSIELLLEGDPFIRQALLLGDRKPFMAALVAPDAAAIAAALGKPAASLTDADMRGAIMRRIQDINRRLDDHERIRDIALVDDFPDRIRSIIGFKVKIDRKAVQELYAARIQQIYQSR